jgi:hypothetical protein
MYSIYPPTKQNDFLLDFEKEAFKNFYDLVKLYSSDFRKTIYISPCSSSAVYTANLISTWNGCVAGFLDNNLSAPGVLYCLEKSYSVIKTTDFINDGNSIVFLFGQFSNKIAAQLDSIGMKEYKDYVITGLF